MDKKVELFCIGEKLNLDCAFESLSIAHTALYPGIPHNTGGQAGIRTISPAPWFIRLWKSVHPVPSH